MKRSLAVCLILCVASTHVTPASDRAAEPTTLPASANAALQYWQAFALLPQGSDAATFDDARIGDPKTSDLTRSLRTSLHFLHRGAAMDACDWGLAYEDGFMCLMPHLSKSRLLATGALLSARVDWAEHRPKEGVRALEDVLTLSRHVANDPLLVSQLVAISIRALAVNEAAEHVPGMPPELLRDLGEYLAHASPLPSLAESIRFEKRMALETVRSAGTNPSSTTALIAALSPAPPEQRAALEELLKNPKALDAELQQLDEAYEATARRADAVLAHRPAAAAPETKPAGMLAAMIVPAVDRSAMTLLRSEVECQMLRAGIAIALEGADALRKFPDPSDGKAFGYRKTAGGFELSSELVFKEKPVTMNFGDSAEKQ